MILSTSFFGLAIDRTLRQLIGDLGVDMTITLHCDSRSFPTQGGLKLQNSTLMKSLISVTLIYIYYLSGSLMNPDTNRDTQLSSYHHHLCLEFHLLLTLPFLPVPTIRPDLILLDDRRRN